METNQLEVNKAKMNVSGILEVRQCRHKYIFPGYCNLYTITCSNEVPFH